MKGLAKCFTTLGALFILAFGLAMLIGTFYLIFNDEVFLGNTSVKWIMLGTSFGVSTAIIMGAAEGMYGICKEKPRYVCMFQIFVIIFMVLFIGLGVLLVLAPDIVFNGDCKTSTNKVIEEASQLYNKSYENFCQGPCPCALDRTSDQFLNTYSLDEIAILALYNVSDIGPKNTQDCPNGNFSDPEKALFTVVGELQKVLNCSMWCADDSVNNLIFRFSDVNSGKPGQFCYQKVKELFDHYDYIAKYCLFGAGGVMVLMFACNMYLCCCVEERKGRRARERFMIMEDERDDYGRLDRGYRRDDYDRYERRR